MNCFINILAIVMVVLMNTGIEGAPQVNNVKGGADAGTGPVSPFDFGQLLAGYFQSLYNYHQYLAANAYATFTVDPSFTGTITAHASLIYPTYEYPYYGFQAAQAAQQQAFLNQQGFPNFPSFPSFPQFPGVPQGSHSAGASAAIGSGGVQQTAFLNPSNPASPNVNVGSRFGPAPASGGDGKYQGVFTSSSITASNVDGKETVHRQATTTVNDNGKITSHTVHDKK